MAKKITHDSYARLSDNEKCALSGELLRRKWEKIGRESQQPFAEPTHKVSVFMAGRGSGKSAAAINWIMKECLLTPNTQACILGPTFKVSVNESILGPSGILARLPDKSIADWSELKKSLKFSNGSTIKCYSAEQRQDMRGPNFHLAWIDEVADLAHGMECWNILFPAVRLPCVDKPSRIYVTGTPRPTELMLALMDRHHNDPSVYELKTGKTFDNIDNLDATTVNELKTQYAGSRYYLQEMEGVLLREAENALWTQDTVSASRVPYQDLAFDRIAIGVDPAVSSDKKADHTGIIVGGVCENKAYILADYSRRSSPLEWSRDLVEIARKHHAGSIVYEKNLAGPLIRDVMTKTLQEMDAAIRLKPVQARGSKGVRAEPVAALYEAGRVYHMPNPDDPKCSLDLLESQMTTWEPTMTKSPDRIDALVHLVQDLVFGSSRSTILLPSMMPWGK